MSKEALRMGKHWRQTAAIFRQTSPVRVGVMQKMKLRKVCRTIHAEPLGSTGRGVCRTAGIQKTTRKEGHKAARHQYNGSGLRLHQPWNEMRSGLSNGSHHGLQARKCCKNRCLSCLSKRKPAGVEISGRTATVRNSHGKDRVGQRLRYRHSASWIGAAGEYRIYPGDAISEHT